MVLYSPIIWLISNTREDWEGGLLERILERGRLRLGKKQGMGIWALGVAEF